MQDNITLADLFSEAAKAYLKNPEKYKKVMGSINRGKDNG